MGNIENLNTGGREMQRRVVTMLFAVVLVVASMGVSYGATWANPGLLMEAKDVKKVANKSDWVILDCRKLKDYAKGHIPGAINLGKQCKKGLRDKTSRMFRDTKKYEKLFGKIGIGSDTHVVVYGEHVTTDTMKDVTVAFWILEVLGHDKVHVLNGGLDGWVNAGYSLDNKPTIKPAKTFKAKYVASRYATTDEVYDVATGKKSAQLIDARSKKENKGADIRALRGGAIPKTVALIPHKDTFEKSKDAATGKMVDNGFLTYETVANLYKGLDPNQRAIAYCQTGTRSTLTYLEMRLLGFKSPANYDDSWTVWGNSYKDFPVEGEQWMNFARIRKLEKKLKKLEEAVAGLTAEEEGK
jgi:thiosulfate/3-mercaptopyruvate sulfurtransferase